MQKWFQFNSAFKLIASARDCHKGNEINNSQRFIHSGDYHFQFHCFPYVASNADSDYRNVAGMSQQPREWEEERMTI